MPSTVAAKCYHLQFAGRIVSGFGSVPFLADALQSFKVAGDVLMFSRPDRSKTRVIMRAAPIYKAGTSNHVQAIVNGALSGVEKHARWAAATALAKEPI